MSAVSTAQQPGNARRLTLLLSDEAAAALRAEAFAVFERQKPSAERGGLLTKSFRGDSISMVDGLESMPCEYLYGSVYRLSPADINALRLKIRHIQAFGTQNVVGFFRSSTRESFSVAPEDIAVVREVIGGTVPIFIAKPTEDGKCTLRVFWPGDDLNWLHFEEFELPNAPVPQKPEQTVAPARPQAAYIPHPSKLPIATSSPREPIASTMAILLHRFAKDRRRVLWAFLALAACLVLAYLSMRPYRDKEPSPRTADLNLQAEMQGNTLRLTWNKSLLAVRNATDAKLQIDDGGKHRDIDLDSDQVSHGAIVYAPASDDVLFRLQVRGRGVEQIIGSLRVLSGAKRGAPESALNMGITPAPSFIPELRPNTSFETQQLPAFRPSSSIKAEPVNRERRPVKPLPQEAQRSARVQPDSVHAGPAGPASTPPTGALTPTESKGGVQSASAPSLTPNSELISSVRAGQNAPPTTPAIPQPGQEIRNQRKEGQAENSTLDVSNPVRIPSAPSSATDTPVPPRPLKQVMPMAGTFGAPAVVSGMTIAVQIKIDESGHVLEARALPSASKNLYWASKSIEAAKQWTFEPAKIHGESVRSDYTITFKFAPTPAGYNH